MIYTKGKAGYYMGNTDIVAAPLSDANEKNTTEHSTIFDDVFRTIAQKMPQLLIPLINEVFHTSYSDEDHFEQLRNEHYEKFGTVVTDSIIRIGNHIYHLECQSSKDKTSYACLNMIFQLLLSTLLLNQMISGKLNFRSHVYFISAITVHFRIFTKRL